MDGLRGLSICAVMVGHVLGLADAVYVLVDSFFVLSGFLLAYGLLRTAERTGRVPVRQFFIARALRLLPTFLLALALVCVLSALTRGNVGATTSTGSALLAAVSLFGNWYVALANAGLGYLGHMWFLNMEEQFYFALPFLVGLIVRRPSRAIRWLSATVATIVVARAALTFLVSAQLNLWTPLRADGMLIGVLTAVCWSRRKEMRPRFRVLERPLVGWSILISVLALCALIDLSGHMLRLSLLGGSTLVGLATAAGLWHFLTAPDSSGSRFFSRRPLVAAGRWSYGLYLFHYPLYIYASVQPWPLVTRAAFVAISTALLTTFSWLAFERPAIRALERRTAALRTGNEPTGSADASVRMSVMAPSPDPT